MRYVAAYLLANLAGKSDPDKSDLEKILSSVGIEAEKEKLTNVLNSLKGKSINEVIAAGELKLASVPSGGGGGGGGGDGGGGAVKSADTAAAPVVEEKKEEKKPESEEESDDDMGFGLFD